MFDVEYGSKYRLRWIGALSLMHLAIEISPHNQTIVAVDGSHTEPIETNYIEIMGGQRYDTILHTKSKQSVEEDGVSGGGLSRSGRRRFAVVGVRSDIMLPLIGIRVEVATSCGDNLGVAPEPVSTTGKPGTCAFE